MASKKSSSGKQHKALIPMDDYGIFADKSATARANSVQVAKMFRKNHKDVLRDIEKLEFYIEN